VTALAIIGSNGQLGWELVRQCRQRGIACHALDFPEIDIADAASIQSRLWKQSLAEMIERFYQNEAGHFSP